MHIGVKNVSFSGNFVNLLNEWSPSRRFEGQDMLRHNISEYICPCVEPDVFWKYFRNISFLPAIICRNVFFREYKDFITFIKSNVFRERAISRFYFDSRYSKHFGEPPEKQPLLSIFLVMLQLEDLEPY